MMVMAAWSWFDCGRDTVLRITREDDLIWIARRVGAVASELKKGEMLWRI
jgi:hypothetical protein